MYKVYAINGSPRKGKNTDTLLNNVIQGIQSNDHSNITAEKFHLYDYTYTGCRSCFECKRKNGINYGRCAVQDDLKPILDKLDEADAIVFGTPVYLTSITGQLQCLIERFLFPKLSYDDPIASIANKRMPTAFVYTMNVTQEGMENADYIRNFSPLLSYFERLLTKPRILYAFNTLQFDNYVLYHNKRFSPEEKAKWHQTQFPEDCKYAHQLGCDLYNEMLQSKSKQF